MDYRSLVESKLTPVGGNYESNVVYRCPKCEGEDGSGHLYVSYKKNKFHCFKCEYGGPLSALLGELGYKKSIDYEKIEQVYSSELSAIADTVFLKPAEKRIVEYSRNLDNLTLYYCEHSKSLSDEARNYLTHRGLSPDTIVRYGILEGVNRRGTKFSLNGRSYEGSDYSGRIMIPSLVGDGRISFYVGRDYTGLKSNKYVNPPQELAYSSEDVWNLHRVNSRSVIICEGVFTAIAAGGKNGNAVATYGKSISQRSNSDNPLFYAKSQGEKLLERNFDSYVVAYDADATKSSLKTCEYLHERGARVYRVKIDPCIYGEHADVDSIGYEEFVRILKDTPAYPDIEDMIGLTSTD